MDGPMAVVNEKKIVFFYSTKKFQVPMPLVFARRGSIEALRSEEIDFNCLLMTENM
jgi:hypothetical protein